MSTNEVRPIKESYLRNKLRNCFESAQELTGHQTLVEKCKKLYKKCDNHELFLKEFTLILKYCFVYTEKTGVERMLNFAAKLAVAIYVSEKQINEVNISGKSNEVDEDDEDMGLFVTGLLEFLFEIHGAAWPDARLRCVQLINKVLTGMPENSSISDDVWKKLSDSMLIRLQDRNALVRGQAVLAARKLQDPRNPNCEIIKAFKFHLNDPQAAVRRAVVSSIAINKATIGYILSKTRDVNDNVRRHAYLVFSKVKITSLSIKHRLLLLERGLKDRSASVLSCVKKVLLTNWLENLNNDIIQLLSSLDVVSSPDVSILLLDALFESLKFEELVKHLPIDESHTVPVDKLTPEVSLYWRCLSHHLHKHGMDEELDDITPGLSKFCDYIKSYYPFDDDTFGVDMNQSQDEQWADIQRKQSLKHLIYLLKVFDLSDEMGRGNLKKLIISMLLSTKIHINTVESLIELLYNVIPDANQVLDEITEVISEIREPINQVVVEMPAQDVIRRKLKLAELKVNLNELQEHQYQAIQNKDFLKAQTLKQDIEKLEQEVEQLSTQPIGVTQEVREEKNDPVTLSRCLCILMETMKHCRINRLTPSLRSLLDNFVENCLTSHDLQTQSLAVHVLAQFCVLDKDLAKEKLVIFLLMVAQSSDNEICIPALKGIFDLIQTYGIESFETLDETRVEGAESKNRSKSRTLLLEDDFETLNETVVDDDNYAQNNCARCLTVLKTLLETNSNEEMKKTAYEGFCKLLATGVIHSVSILTKIILTGFSTVKEDDCIDFIRQVFIVFFPIFASRTPGSQEMILKCFMPTVQLIIDAPVGTPEIDIQPADVALFLVAHTKPGVNEFTSQDLHVHNTLAIKICNELLKDPVRLIEHRFVYTYLRSLNNLNLCFKQAGVKDEIKTAVEKLRQELTEKRSVQLLNEFGKKADVLSSLLNIHSVENTLATTGAETSTTSLTSRITDIVSSTRNSNMQTILSRDSKLTPLEECIEDVRVSDSSSLVSAAEIHLPTGNVIPESPDQSFSSDSESTRITRSRTRQTPLH